MQVILVALSYVFLGYVCWVELKVPVIMLGVVGYGASRWFFT